MDLRVFPHSLIHFSCFVHVIRFLSQPRWKRFFDPIVCMVKNENRNHCCAIDTWFPILNENYVLAVSKKEKAILAVT
ncbi:MAG: hypothetical protein C4527_07740 [Candidatus Omnitrophota bacterium]|nr:MAG: hypothetical protein C4527_07740 [Candidatus Omnitrophota bacterium]